MRFSEAYRSRAEDSPVISFEMFPPKTEAALEKFDRILPELSEDALAVGVERVAGVHQPATGGPGLSFQQN